MIFQDMKRLGILGINNRIGRYILPLNERKNYPLVDNKVKTAARAQAWGIAMPENYLVIENNGDLKNLANELAQRKSFVVKPANGSQGNGILVIIEVLRDQNDKICFKRSNGKIMSLGDIKHHISGILSGLYSLSGSNDIAIIQQKIEIHPVFEDYCFGGIPDVRVIVLNGFPVMSMVRLPTRSSDGKANLHQGAIGAGIRIKDGTTQNAVIRNKVVFEHPDTHKDIRGLVIPDWREVLDLSARCYDMVGLGYIGVDIVITPHDGPILLELNARPGLAIQIANQAGLLPRLEKISQDAPKGLSARERVDYSMSVF